MKFELVTALELNELLKEVERECYYLLDTNIARVIVDVDFIMDINKMYQYRAIIKYR